MISRESLWRVWSSHCSSVPYVKGMTRHRHRAWGLLCAAAGGEPRPGDHSKQSDGAVWLRLASGETHTHHSQEETCTRPDVHRDLHSADTKHTHTHTTQTVDSKDKRQVVFRLHGCDVHSWRNSSSQNENPVITSSLHADGKSGEVS